MDRTFLGRDLAWAMSILREAAALAVSLCPGSNSDGIPAVRSQLFFSGEGGQLFDMLEMTQSSRVQEKAV